MNENKCPECGFELPEGNFCPECKVRRMVL